MNKLTQQYLQEIFEYKDGELFWKKKICDRVNIGDKVGGIGADGYVQTSINGKHYRQHRLVYLMHHGYLPKRVDHYDRNKTNNKIENLRGCNQGENRCNSKTRSDNKLGIRNVRLIGPSYYVNVSRNTYGPFKDLELAQLVAQEARNKHHKQFAYKDEL